MARNVTVLEEGKDLFPLGDGPSQKDLEGLGELDRYSCVKGTLTGEFRPPKKGEWFLSGAIPTCYKASNDLSGSYNIVKLCKFHRIRAGQVTLHKGSPQSIPSPLTGFSGTSYVLVSP